MFDADIGLEFGIETGIVEQFKAVGGAEIAELILILQYIVRITETSGTGDAHGAGWHGGRGIQIELKVKIVKHHPGEHGEVSAGGRVLQIIPIEEVACKGGGDAEPGSFLQEAIVFQDIALVVTHELGIACQRGEIDHGVQALINGGFDKELLGQGIAAGAYRADGK